MTNYPLLPTSSAAEFHLAALEYYKQPMPPSAWYVPAIGLRGFIAFFSAFLALACLDSVFNPSKVVPNVLLGPLGVVVFGGFSFFLIGWKIHSRRRERHVNTFLIQRSLEIDEMVQRGEIPLAPTNWDRPVPDTLSNLSAY